jgi:small subunit ribosomal protein S9
MKEIEKQIKKSSNTNKYLSAKPIAHGTGRRKSSVARVWLHHGNGTITINKKDYSSYCSTDVAKALVTKPLAILNVGDSFSLKVFVEGGGVHSQADAIKLGISRALLSYDSSYRPLLRANKLLTVDSRLKERKKYGQKGARKKFQFVKR